MTRSPLARSPNTHIRSTAISVPPRAAAAPDRLPPRRPGLLAGLLAGLLQRLAAAWQRRLDREHLHALDDRLLRDIGLQRGDIDRAVEGRVPRRHR